MYERCYLADGCGGDEACAALCPERPRTSDREHTADDEIRRQGDG